MKVFECLKMPDQPHSMFFSSFEDQEYGAPTFGKMISEERFSGCPLVFNSTESNYYYSGRKIESSLDLVEGPGFNSDQMEINLLDSSFNFNLDPFSDFFLDCNAEMKNEKLDSLMLNR